MNRKIIAGILSIVIGFTGAMMISGTRSEAHSIQKGIAEEIVRFHVLANSDSEEDQQLKLKVKTHIVSYMKDMLKDAKSVEETKKSIQSNLNQIVKEASSVIKSEGYGYTATAELMNCYFPVKTYGDCTFPEGFYDALRIKIGKAEGKNWWCVLYPNLCFVDTTHAVVPKKEKKQLKHVLTEKEYDEVTDKKKTVIRFKYLKFLNPR